MDFADPAVEPSRHITTTACIDTNAEGIKQACVRGQATVSRKSGYAIACYGGDHSSAGGNFADAVIVSIRDINVTARIHSYTIRPVETCIHGYAARAEAQYTVTRDGRNQAG